METSEYIESWIFFSMFKSYYVVWKPRYLNTELGQPQKV